jgi:ABC-2 type transport system ATP-binding protein
MNGVLAPSGGSVRVLGMSPETDGPAVRQHTGVLTETPSLYEGLSARDNLRFFGALYGLTSDTLARKMTETLTFVGLADRVNDRVSNTAADEAGRMIAASLLHDPDPAARRADRRRGSAEPLVDSMVALPTRRAPVYTT